MRRHRQTLEELLGQLSPVDTSWRDDHANAVIAWLQALPKQERYTRAELVRLFDIDNIPDDVKPKDHFAVGFTTAQLFLDMSKDEIRTKCARCWGKLRASPFSKSGRMISTALWRRLGILDKMTAIVNTPVQWTDILTERLKGGRGSAIKGQRRGRALEDFVEELIIEIFGAGHYEDRCKFTGANGLSSEKCDFAIPNKEDPSVLIEVKAYGATGSKQTDVLGDLSRIGIEKRPDTHFLLVTDGVTWRDRQSDLGRLVELQNHGEIYRIYTQTMRPQLEEDLRQLKAEFEI